MSSASVSILMLGLPLDWFLERNPDKGFIVAALEKSFEETRTYPGVDAELCFVNPDREAQDLGALRDKLAAGPSPGGGRRHFDGVSIGFGVRGNPEYTPLFEKMVNLVRETSPKTTFMFTGTTSDHVDIIRRNFPQIK